MAQRTVAPVTASERASISLELQRYEARYQLNLTPPERESIINNAVREMQRMRENGDAGTVKQALVPALYEFAQGRGDPKLAERTYFDLEHHNVAFQMAMSSEQMRQIEEREFPGWLRGQGMTPFQYEMLPAAGKEGVYSEFRSWLRENNSSYLEAASTYDGLRQVFEEIRRPQEGR